MDTLTKEEFESLPWIEKYTRPPSGCGKPPYESVKTLVHIPFHKRSIKYSCFYCHQEIFDLLKNEKGYYLDCCTGFGMIPAYLQLKRYKGEACDIENNFKVTNVPFKRVDLNKKTPYEDNSFDIIINREGIHYLANPRAFIKEVSRILRKNRVFIFSFPNIHNLNSRWNFLRNGLLSGFHKSSLGGRIFVSYFWLIEYWLKENGFKIEKTVSNCPNSFTWKQKVILPFLKLFVKEKSEMFLYGHTTILKARLVNKR